MLTAITCSLYLTPRSASDSTLRVANANECFFAFSSYLTHQQLCHYWPLPSFIVKYTSLGFHNTTLTWFSSHFRFFLWLLYRLRPLQLHIKSWMSSRLDLKLFPLLTPSSIWTSHPCPHLLRAPGNRWVTKSHQGPHLSSELSIHTQTTCLPSLSRGPRYTWTSTCPHHAHNLHPQTESVFPVLLKVSAVIHLSKPET